MDPVLSLLDRQVAALAAQEQPEGFLVSVEPFLRALNGEPRIAVHLDDLRDETLNRVRVLENADDELVLQLRDLRERLVQLRPDLDDSSTHNDSSLSLAEFDAIVVAERPPLNYQGHGARTALLLEILQASADHILSGESAGAHAWMIDLGNAQERWDHAVRWLDLSMRVSAGLVLIRLENVPKALNPDPRIQDVGESREDRLNRLMREAISVERQLFIAVHHEPANPDFVATYVSELRDGLSRLHLELHTLIGTLRSRRALIDRFKIRAEWHDAWRLRQIASTDVLASGPEERLTAEFARFLFDQGLSPLTKPMAGGLQPDLLDGSIRPAFYVEAKQYDRSARQALISSLGQVLDTVGLLQGSAYAVDEAFCVVFRRGGPRYLLPDSVEADGYRVYFTLIDIAPAEVSGRRQGFRPSRITEAELLDAMTEPPEQSVTD